MIGNVVLRKTFQGGTNSVVVVVIVVVVVAAAAAARDIIQRYALNWKQSNYHIPYYTVSEKKRGQ